MSTSKDFTQEGGKHLESSTSPTIQTPASPDQQSHNNNSKVLADCPASEDLVALSPIRPLSSPNGDLPFQDYKENVHLLGSHDQRSKFCSTPSPLRYHAVGNDYMRHNLLVQRTFNTQEDIFNPLTSSPLKGSPGLTQNTLAVPRSTSKEHFPDGSCIAGCSSQSIFKTPIRGEQQDMDRVWERTPSAPRTPGFSSPASSQFGYTPGRQFVNPFEDYTDRLNMPALTPTLFKIKTAEPSSEKEEFWSVEQQALMMPVEIKESEIKRQYYHQSKRDRNVDPALQQALLDYFSNGVIAPSPWSEKIPRVLPELPPEIKSVSCQTMMSVPPDVDLFAELGDKYRLPDESQLVHESPMDCLTGSFIRRKLLHQLNENEDAVGASPILTANRSTVHTSCRSTSPSPPKQVTPELEKQTPNKKSSGHFSSSPIRPSSDKGNYPAMSESDLLASPELSPIAGRGSRGPVRSSDIFTPLSEFERSREIMQLDFSSILDEPDEFDAAEQASYKTDTLVHTKGVSSSQPLSEAVPNASPSDFLEQTSNSTSCLSNAVGEEAQLNSCSKSSNALKKSLLTSALSVESNQEMNVPNLLSSLDTGYQTASLQSIAVSSQDSTSSSSIQHPQDAGSSMISSSQDFSFSRLRALPISSAKESDGSRSLDHRFSRSFSSQSMQQHTGLYRDDKENSLDSFIRAESHLSSLYSDDRYHSRSSFNNAHRVCKIRKVRTLADVRRAREKSNASRDLTSSFNEEAKSSTTMVTRLSRSLSNPSLHADSSRPEASPEIGAAQEAILKPRSMPNCASDIEFEKPRLSPSILKSDSDIPSSLTMKIESKLKTDTDRAILCLEKRPFENIGNVTDSSMLEALSDHKHMKFADAESGTLKDNSSFCTQIKSRFSLEDKTSLEEARELLGRSEAMRRQHSNDSKNLQEGDSLYSFILDQDESEILNAEDEHQESVASSRDENANTKLLPSARFEELHPVRMSTPDKCMFDSMEEKINSIESVKLGSEIAAEIMKRAGDDLAQLSSSK